MERTKFDVCSRSMQHALMQFSMPSGHGPVMWWKGRSISLTMILILTHVAALVFTAALLGFQARGVIEKIVFFVPDVFRGEIWRFVTFPFLLQLSFWTVIELFMLWMFGTQIEQVLGWRRFLKLYGTLCLSPAIFMLLIAPWSTFPYSGTDAANFAVFIAFTTIYPDAMMLFGTKAKWWAWGLLGLLFLQAVAFEPVRIVCAASLFTAGVAYGYLKFQGIQGGFDWLNRWKEQREEVRYQRAQRKRLLESKEHFISEQVDPILDKIARHGMQSLTEEEKRILARAKDKLR